MYYSTMHILTPTNIGCVLLDVIILASELYYIFHSIHFRTHALLTGGKQTRV